MSGIGKNSTGYTKQDYPESKIPALGFKKLKFGHQATAGDTGISFGSLTLPTIMANNGFVQPNFVSLMEANLGIYKNNLIISSSVRGPMELDFDYTIGSSSRINFVGFQALQDEVFVGTIDPVCFTGTLVADGSAQPVTGPLPVGTTQFNVGFPFEINKFPGQQVGALQFFRNGKLQVRNLGNSPTGVGNYYEVPVSGGLGYLIQFNLPGVLLPDGSQESIVGLVNGFLLERPQDSILATVQNLQGQLDSVVPTVAALAGVPVINYQIAPNDPDLRQFGDLVLNLLAQLNAQRLARFHLSNVTVTTSGSVYKIVPYDTADLLPSPSFGTMVNGLFTFSQPGCYMAFANVSFPAGALGAGDPTYWLSLFLDGSEYSHGHEGGASNVHATTTCSDSFRAIIGTALTMQVNQGINGSANLDTTNPIYNTISIVRLGN